MIECNNNKRIFINNLQHNFIVYCTKYTTFFNIFGRTAIFNITQFQYMYRDAQHNQWIIIKQNVNNISRGNNHQQTKFKTL